MSVPEGNIAAVPVAASPWSPLRRRTFRMLWIATLASNVGTWMHDVGAGWLMTSLSPSPVMVALVQTATTLPIFLLALPAGALSDIVDRRRLLIAVQLWMGFVAALLAIVVFSGMMNAWLFGAYVKPEIQSAEMCKNGMYDVVTESNYLYSLATVFTLGIWMPMDVSFRCKAPGVTGGGTVPE